MASSSLQDARDRHERLVSALAEYKAAGEDSDSVLGVFGLALSYSSSIQGGILTIQATLHHADGAWISTTTAHNGDSPQLYDRAMRLARHSLVGGPA